jgi:hypothetical protein
MSALLLRSPPHPLPKPSGGAFIYMAVFDPSPSARSKTAFGLVLGICRPEHRNRLVVIFYYPIREGVRVASSACEARAAEEDRAWCAERSFCCLP